MSNYTYKTEPTKNTYCSCAAARRRANSSVLTYWKLQQYTLLTVANAHIMEPLTIRRLCSLTATHCNRTYSACHKGHDISIEHSSVHASFPSTLEQVRCNRLCLCFKWVSVRQPPIIFLVGMSLQIPHTIDVSSSQLDSNVDNGKYRDRARPLTLAAPRAPQK